MVAHCRPSDGLHKQSDQPGKLIPHALHYTVPGRATADRDLRTHTGIEQTVGSTGGNRARANHRPRAISAGALVRRRPPIRALQANLLVVYRGRFPTHTRLRPRPKLAFYYVQLSRLAALPSLYVRSCPHMTHPLRRSTWPVVRSELDLEHHRPMILR